MEGTPLIPLLQPPPSSEALTTELTEETGAHSQDLPQWSVDLTLTETDTNPF